MAEPNILLDALIDEAGMSHASVAARINTVSADSDKPTRYDHTAIARWIRDRAIPRGSTPEVLCDLLSERLGRPITLADIGMAGATESGDEVSLAKTLDRAAAMWRSDQREQLPTNARVADGSAAVAPIFEWENPPDDLDVSRNGRSRVVAQHIQLLVDARQRYERMYRQVGGLPVRPRLLGFLNNHVAPLLRASYSDETGRQLLRAAGGLVALAGICAYDADRQALSQRYQFQALRMAKASGDRAFGGYVVALLSNQAMHLRRYRLVLQYTETALRGASGELSPALRADLHSLQAKAFARMGHRTDAHAQMDAAETTAGQIVPADEPAELGYVQPGLVETQNAEALRRLGDFAAAQVYAEESIRIGGDSHLRGKVHRYAGLAIILATQGEVERAADFAMQMLDHSQGMESWRMHDRVLGVQDVLREHGAGSPAVREFSDRVDDQLHLPL